MPSSSMASTWMSSRLADEGKASDAVICQDLCTPLQAVLRRTPPTHRWNGGFTLTERHDDDQVGRCSYGLRRLPPPSADRAGLSSAAGPPGGPGGVRCA